MEQSKTAPPCAEELADPHGQLLGRVVAPRPGPVTGRASGTVYLVRQARTPISPLPRRVRPDTLDGDRSEPGGR